MAYKPREAVDPVPTIKTPVPGVTCGNCGGPHATAVCPIPADFDGDYRRNADGSFGCNCAE